jgi:hypothetical protein
MSDKPIEKELLTLEVREQMKDGVVPRDGVLRPAEEGVDALEQGVERLGTGLEVRLVNGEFEPGPQKGLGCLNTLTKAHLPFISICLYPKSDMEAAACQIPDASGA